MKDDAQHDPQWSEEQILAAGLTFAGVKIGQHELDIISKTTVGVFEIVERAWATQDCALVDMKIEYGIDSETGKACFLITLSSQYSNHGSCKKSHFFHLFRFTCDSRISVRSTCWEH
jgi:SAICAR synthetase